MNKIRTIYKDDNSIITAFLDGADEYITITHDYTEHNVSTQSSVKIPSKAFNGLINLLTIEVGSR